MRYMKDGATIPAWQRRVHEAIAHADRVIRASAPKADAAPSPISEREAQRARVIAGTAALQSRLQTMQAANAARYPRPAARTI